ncbi:damage-inducible protein DinB [Pseudoduganella eburnea]|uniref:Damage-inducible protein DinB n=1 Tax=Massilia eburnea TaxID=1776165 RepID=A0A6L6QIZ2_9BURK|nr:DinB family protein [Massilia eburnea]MTW11606.1 damage-inducible protein DinB [Massilia eburnea]
MLIDGFKYKQWADRRTLDAAKALEAQKGRAAVAFIRQQLNHMVIVEELFRARLIGNERPHNTTNTEAVPTLDELERKLTQSNAWFTRYVNESTSETLNEQVSFQFVDGKQGRLTRLEILFHIINHGTYHRGAIGHALDLEGGVRPADTFTVFIHAEEPERRQQSSMRQP